MYYRSTKNSIHGSVPGTMASAIAAMESVGILLGFVRNPKFHIVNSVISAERKARMTP